MNLWVSSLSEVHKYRNNEEGWTLLVRVGVLAGTYGGRLLIQSQVRNAPYRVSSSPFYLWSVHILQHFLVGQLPTRTKLSNKTCLSQVKLFYFEKKKQKNTIGYLTGFLYGCFLDAPCLVIAATGAFNSIILHETSQWKFVLMVSMWDLCVCLQHGVSWDLVMIYGQTKVKPFPFLKKKRQPPITEQPQWLCRLCTVYDVFLVIISHLVLVKHYFSLTLLLYNK